MNQYFKDCKSTDDVKRLYRELAKKLHPDHGGKSEDMIELQKQYESWVPENIQEQIQSWGKRFENASYGGYGGYRYNTNANMRQEYYNQRDDPRLTDYERMKAENISLKCSVNVLRDLNVELDKENQILKKKVQTQKRQLEKLKNMPNPEKKKKMRPLKSRNSSSIAL